MSVEEGLHSKFRRVFMDNFYSSVPLLTDLLGLGIYAVGTIRSNKRCPTSKSVEAKIMKRMKRGETIYRRGGSLPCQTWNNTSDVTLLSTCICTNATGNDSVRRNTVDAAG
eukprot:scpid82146/ scgid33625/ 